MKFHLAKWRECRPEHCPRCNKKRFTPYVDEQGNRSMYGEVRFGRCSRENSCGYHVKPWEHLPSSSDNLQSYQPPQREERRQLRYLDPEWVASCSGNNPFVEWIRKQYGAAALELVNDQFDLGTYSIGNVPCVVFWQTDIEGNVHTGKAMTYEVVNGQLRRTKGRTARFAWMHNKSPLPLQEGEWMQQFFGLRQLRDADKPVAVVESEKTAILASLHFPEWIWLATAGSSNLTAYNNEGTLFEALRGRQVMLFPDSDKADEWITKSKQLASQGHSVKVNLEWMEGVDADLLNKGIDLADLLMM
jgi:hypothetical protein